MAFTALFKNSLKYELGSLTRQSLVVYGAYCKNKRVNHRYPTSHTSMFVWRLTLPLSIRCYSGTATEMFGNQTVPSYHCWYCSNKTKVSSFFCEECGYIQPPSCLQCNFFEYLSCTPQFDLDVHELQQKFRNLQRRLHPDKFYRKSEKERSLSQDQSASLNNAYKILSSDLLRAQYLLKLHGEDVLAEGKSLADPEVLTEILDVREELEDTNSKEVIQKIYQVNQQKYNKVVAELKKNFSEQDYEAAKRNTIYLQYLSKIKEEVEQKMDK